MDYVINANTQETSPWINKGNNFLKSKYGAALYIVALIIVVILYNYGTDISSLKNSISSSFLTTSYTSTSNGMNKGATIIIGIAALLVFIGIVLYVIRLYNYNNSQVISLVKGVSDGKNMKVLDKLNLLPSSNRSTGAEFAYSGWLKISDWTYNALNSKYILLKGKLSGGNTIISQAPSVQLTSTNTLRISTQTFGSGLSSPLLVESVELPDIPLKRWFHLLVGVSGRNLDIYINGVLAKRKELGGLVALNDDPLYISPPVDKSMSGFGGLIYDVKYYSYYPSQDEILMEQNNIPSKDAAACE